MSQTLQLADLSSRALLSDVDVKLWLAKVTDKKIGNEVADQHKVTRKSGRWEKQLFPFERPEYDELAQCLYGVYKYWQDHTVPWQFGVRLLKSTFFGTFNGYMKLKADEVAKLRREFGKVYPSYIEKAEVELKLRRGNSKQGMFRREDYPDWAKLKEKFGFSVAYDPVVAPGDFRLELDADLMEELKKSHIGEYRKNQHDMSQKLWTRVYDVVNRAAKLANVDAKIYDTIFTDLNELAESLPVLNLLDDPIMTQLAEELKTNLANRDAHIVRTDGGERADVATKAQKLADKMKKFML